jgi:hypothetical protein
MCAPIEVSAPMTEWPRHELVSFGDDNGRAVFRDSWAARMGRTRQHPVRYPISGSVRWPLGDERVVLALGPGTNRRRPVTP